jgi:hypothetical protein
MSNKKTLLNEGTIRRFMKLADMGGLAESYLDRFEVNEGDEEEDEEVKEEGMHAAKEDDKDVKKEGMYAAKEDEEEPAMRNLEEEEEEEMGLDLDADEMGEPMDADAGEAGEAGEADEALVKKIVTAIAGALEGATGVELSVEGGDEEPDMDPMGAPEEEGGEEELEMGAELGDEEPAMRDDVMEDEDFDAYIAEVTKRVAKRIIKSKLSK